MRLVKTAGEEERLVVFAFELGNDPWGVRFRAKRPEAMLRRNLAVYGLGGVIIPFIGIKLVDLVIVALGVS